MRPPRERKREDMHKPDSAEVLDGLRSLLADFEARAEDQAIRNAHVVLAHIEVLMIAGAGPGDPRVQRMLDRLEDLLDVHVEERLVQETRRRWRRSRIKSRRPRGLPGPRTRQLPPGSDA